MNNIIQLFPRQDTSDDILSLQTIIEYHIEKLKDGRNISTFQYKCLVDNVVDALAIADRKLTRLLEHIVNENA